MVGGASGSGDNTLLSVSKYLFGKVCPNSTVILEDVNTERMRFSETAPLTETFDAWVQIPERSDDPCSTHRVTKYSTISMSHIALCANIQAYIYRSCRYLVRKNAYSLSGPRSPIPRSSPNGIGLPSSTTHTPAISTFFKPFPASRVSGAEDLHRDQRTARDTHTKRRL